jgi:2-polyprenyl-3-methyl-5-hydroxy-6-metoxy-1,4-benzoquinol methylase
MASEPSMREILDKVRERVQSRSAKREAPRYATPPTKIAQAGIFDMGALRRELHSCNMLHNAVGTINPRRPGIHNQAIQFVKKAMRRSLTWYTRPLHQFHGAVTRTLNETTKAIQFCFARIETLAFEKQSQQQQLRMYMETEMNQLRTDVANRLHAMERELRRLSRSEVAAPVQVSTTPSSGTTPETSTTPDFDYRGFEDRFRGPQNTIRERQENYLDLFRGNDNVVDIGCGRGEFLEVLRDAGITARGVDSDEDMAQTCRSKGLDVTHGDLFATLESAPDESLGGIFCSQVIEHLPWHMLFRVAQLAHRKLKPSAPVVLETINPECVAALVRNFILDPTHVRPVHPEMLQFLLESLGFSRVHVRFSSPVPDDRKMPSLVLPDGGPALDRFNRGIASINSLLFGYQDYAVVAWR